MKINFVDYETSIKFSDDNVNVLCIENKALFYDVVNQFVKLSNGISVENNIILFDNNDECNMSKNIIVYSDYFDIEYNSKSILNKLYAKVNENLDEGMNAKLQLLLNDLMRLYNGYLSDIDLELEYNDQINFFDLCKLLKLQIKTDNDNLLNKIQLIVDIESQLRINKLIIFNNLLQYFNDKERKMLYKYIIAKKVDILFVENTLTKKIYDNEIIHIIDSDFDEFLI